MLRTLAFVALWIFIFVTALSGGWSVMFKLSYLLLLLFGAAWLWTRLSARAVEVRREPMTLRAQVGSVVQERITLANSGWLPNPWVEVHAASTLPEHETD